MASDRGPRTEDGHCGLATRPWPRAWRYSWQLTPSLILGQETGEVGIIGVAGPSLTDFLVLTAWREQPAHPSLALFSCLDLVLALSSYGASVFLARIRKGPCAVFRVCTSKRAGHLVSATENTRKWQVERFAGPDGQIRNQRWETNRPKEAMS